LESALAVLLCVDVADHAGKSWLLARLFKVSRYSQCPHAESDLLGPKVVHEDRPVHKARIAPDAFAFERMLLRRETVALLSLAPSLVLLFWKSTEG
jgi:hypothetical protein